MADNVNVLDSVSATKAVATDELSDSSHSPKVSILAGDATTTPISPATSGKQDTMITSLQLIDDVVSTDDTSTHSTGSTKGVNIMAVATPTDSAVSANDIGMVGMTLTRRLHVSVQDVPTDPFGADADAANANGSISAKLRWLATVGPGSYGVIAHDAADGGYGPEKIGGWASAAAPTDVSGDGDIVNAWFLRNGAQATVLTAAGALIGGDAANGLDVDVTRIGGQSPAFNSGAAGATVLRTVTATDDPGVTSLALLDDVIFTDDAAFTPATSKVAMFGAEVDDTLPDSVDEGDAGAVRMSANRNLYVRIRDNAGNERGLNVDANGEVGVTVRSGAFASGALASGSVASGAIASGAVASGAFASGSIASGAIASGAIASGAIAAGAIAAGATSIAENEDVASANADRGVKILFKRLDTPANSSDTDGDYEQPQMSAGRVWASAKIDTALPAGTNAIGKLAANSGVDIGDVDVTSVPTDPFGANADAASATGSISAKLRGIATALGITALDLGSGTGGSRTLRSFRDTAQWTGGSGAASANVQRVLLATDDPAVTSLAIMDDWDSTDACKTVGFGTTVSTSVTHPAFTTAYAANDCWSDSTTAPTAGGFTFTSAARTSGGSGIITDMIVSSSNDPATLLQGEIWISDSAIATNDNDNAAFTYSDADALLLVAVIPFTLASTVAGSGTTSYAHVQNLNIGFTCSGSANLRFKVKVKNAYTPASGEVLNVRLKILQTN